LRGRAFADPSHLVSDRFARAGHPKNRMGSNTNYVVSKASR